MLQMRSILGIRPYPRLMHETLLLDRLGVDLTIKCSPTSRMRP